MGRGPNPRGPPHTVWQEFLGLGLPQLQPNGGSPACHWGALGKTNGFNDARWLSAKSKRRCQSLGCWQGFGCHPGPLSLHGPCRHLWLLVCGLA